MRSAARCIGAPGLEFQVPLYPKDVGLKGAVFADAARSGTTRARPSIRRRRDDGRSSRTATKCGHRSVSAWSGIHRSDPCGSDYSFPITKEGYDKVQQFRFGGGTKFTAAGRPCTWHDRPFFFKPQAGMTLGAIADMTGAKPRGPIAADRVVGGLAPLNQLQAARIDLPRQRQIFRRPANDARGAMSDLGALRRFAVTASAPPGRA